MANKRGRSEDRGREGGGKEVKRGKRKEEELGRGRRKPGERG